MSEATPHCLTFTELDGLAFAATRSRLGNRDSSKVLVAGELGPVMELLQLATDGLLPQLDRVPGLTLVGVAQIQALMASGRKEWIAPDRRVGFFRTETKPPSDETRWTGFRLCAQQAAIGVGFPKPVAHQFAGALGEMLSNIYEHSESSDTGILAFRAVPTLFEFVVADRGIGVLKSLKSCSEHALLDDHGDALQLALTDGCSRHGTGTNHGKGFRPIFTGLSNLNGSLRFRSGDHALTIDGRDPKHTPWKKVKKPRISGFFASISCLLNGTGSGMSAPLRS
jgi:anti-sigma regulatory factor (Ser/Thr protein kinase)